MGEGADFNALAVPGGPIPCIGLPYPELIHGEVISLTATLYVMHIPMGVWEYCPFLNRNSGGVEG